MKKLAPFIFSGILGGIMVLGGFMLYNKYGGGADIVYIENQEAPIRAVSNASNPVPIDFSVAAESASPSVVLIKAQESDARASRRRQTTYNPFSRFFDFGDIYGFNYAPRQGTGSGVIVSEDGYIVTNSHVIDFADIFTVTLNDGREFQGYLVGSDQESDLAILKIEGKDLDPIEVGDSETLKVGEWVLAIGNPFELTNTATAGIISAKGRDLGLRRNGDGISAFIQTDAAVNPGNSGGALVNIDGELIGINTAIFSRDGGYVGYSFAIPVEIVMQKVDEMISNPDRGYLGVTIGTVNDELAKSAGFQVTQGVYVYELQAGGSAHLAGLQPNDVILKLDNNNVKHVEDLQKLMKDKKAGEKVVIDIDRYGERKQISVVLKAS